MKWNNFLKIVLLIIISAMVLYIICPKYYFYYSQGEEGVLRGNIITGELQAYTAATGSWVTIQDKDKTENNN